MAECEQWTSNMGQEKEEEENVTSHPIHVDEKNKQINSIFTATI